ncbi:hypothetical protein HanPI659440_Chr10g0384361 [Helianthus annuus]|nr:hypothetical protein HanPI659440_Chr10g0384361 [Helianthus annuus]
MKSTTVLLSTKGPVAIMRSVGIEKWRDMEMCERLALTMLLRRCW